MLSCSHADSYNRKAAPEGLERSLPESVHPTGDAAGKSGSSGQSHALGGGKDSIVPQKIQEVSLILAHNHLIDDRTLTRCITGRARGS